jgi:putative aldouronate transport system substrate-binding protein
MSIALNGKRLAVKLLSAACALLMIGGCSAAPSASSAPPASAPAEGQATPAPAEERVTLSIATNENYYAAASFAQDLPVFKIMEDAVNVTLKWEVTPGDQYGTVMNTRLAAGTDLPDIINMRASDPTACGANGTVIALEGLVNEQNSPNFLKFIEKYPIFKKLLYSSDGHMYYLSGYRGKAELEGDCYGFAVRQDWLERLNLQKPTSLQEMENVLIAFRDQDANGNGDATDEMPLCLKADDIRLLGMSFGLDIGTTDFVASPEGKLSYAYITDNYKGMLQFANKLYTEKLLDPEYATITDDQIMSKEGRNLVGMCDTWGSSTVSINELIKKNGDANAHFVMLFPLTGLDGTKGHVTTFGMQDGQMSISKDCKYPDRALRFLDYLIYNDDATYLNNVGIKDQTYTLGSNGEIVFTDFVMKNPNGLSPMEALRSVGAYHTMPFICLAEGRYAMNASIPGQNEFARQMAPYINDRIEFSPSTADEATQLSALSTDIKTAVLEWEFKFISGEVSFDQWDAYVSAIKALNVDKMVEIWQAKYDRVNK